MEVLLLAAIAWAMGQQSEQSKLGLTPAHQAQLKEQHRHEKAVRRIAEKHGTPPPAPAPLPGVSPWKEPPAAPVPVPDTFGSGYRSYVPGPRTSTWTGRSAGRAGAWTARGVIWARDTGKSALRTYRERRAAEGHEDPAPVLVPLPPTHPPAVPSIPKEAPTVHERPEPTAGPGPPEAAPVYPDDAEVARWTEVLERAGLGIEPDPTTAAEAVEEPVRAPEEASEPESATEAETAPEAAAEEPATVPEPRKPTDDAPADTAPDTEPEAAKAPETTPEPAAEEEVTPATPDSAPDSGTPQTGNGVGRMAAEVTYESVMDESDELSLMCDEDVQVYDRIGVRCEREIGRADALIADARNAGVGESVIGWISRALEKYQGIHASLDELKENTIAQGEAVVKAKTLLETGQGVYAEIAKDMEDVAERKFYVSDAVDSEDTNAHAETYETRGA
ncbi:hypothetical protein ACFVXW_27090 [Streptomyces sp. NPDC058251]|uniref:hypothetical protein n=1 Tax=Streptomyces sp. NPDC058251 TaxID=3346404 RepID=UPI0036E2459B